MSRGVAGGIRKTQPKANIPNPNAAITWIIFEEGFIAASVHRRRAGDALHENIHASAFLCGEPLRPLRLNFKSHKVQEAFTAEDAEDFAEVRRGTLRRKSFILVSARRRRAGMLCVKLICWSELFLARRKTIRKPLRKPN